MSSQQALQIQTIALLLGCSSKFQRSFLCICINNSKAWKTVILCFSTSLLQTMSFVLCMLFSCHLILFLKQQQQSSDELLLLLRFRHSFNEKEQSGRVSE